MHQVRRHWTDGPRRSFKGYAGAFGFVVRNGMAWMFLVPAMLWVVLSLLILRVISSPVDDLMAWVSEYLALTKGGEGAWGGVIAFLNDATDLFVAIVLKLAVAYLMFTFNKYVVLILLSPLLAYASERTEEIITGTRHPFSWGRWLREMGRGALFAMRNGLLELVLTVMIWVATLLLPLATPVSLILLFAISSYFYGSSMYDYVFERRGMRVRESVAAVNERMGMVLVNGALFNLLMKVPLLGTMFAPILSAVGAVLSLAEEPSVHVPRSPGT